MRTIYVNPGELLNIRVIDDPEIPKTAREWGSQIRPGHILVRVVSDTHIQLAQPRITISQTDFSGEKIKAYR